MEQRGEVPRVSRVMRAEPRRGSRLTPLARRAYFDRFRDKGDFFDTGDAGVIDEQGYVSVLSRADDLIK